MQTIATTSAQPSVIYGSEIILREESLRQFWAAAIAAIRNSSRSDVNGALFSSEELDNYLGGYDIDVRHTYECTMVKGGDSYCGMWEMVSSVKEGFKAIGAFDEDGNHCQEVVDALNAYLANNPM